MRTYPECIPCILQATLTAGRLAGAEEGRLWEALAEAAALAARFDPKAPPIALGAAVAALVRRKLGGGDPFLWAKREGNAKLLEVYPQLQARVRAAPDPLEEALHIAAAANALDLGVYQEVDYPRQLAQALTCPRGRWDYLAFREHLDRARAVLYLADNAGEIVADRLVMEELLARGKRVTLAVRDGPILNDVTPGDLPGVGLPEGVEVITTGSDLPGVFLSHCSPEFRARFRDAELVLSKGMGNFEGLAQERGPIFFVFQAKCVPVAREAGVRLRDLVLAGPGWEGLRGSHGQRSRSA